MLRPLSEAATRSKNRRGGRGVWRPGFRGGSSRASAAGPRRWGLGGAPGGRSGASRSAPGRAGSMMPWAAKRGSARGEPGADAILRTGCSRHVQAMIDATPRRPAAQGREGRFPKVRVRRAHGNRPHPTHAATDRCSSDPSPPWPDDGTLAEFDPSGTPSTSRWTGAAIIVPSPRTTSYIVARPRTSTGPMPFSSAG